MSQDQIQTAPTNAETAQAATVPSSALSRDLMLLGVFSGGVSDTAILLRDAAGQITRLEAGQMYPATGGPIRLVGTGDGWAMIEQGGEIHRLVMG